MCASNNQGFKVLKLRFSPESSCSHSIFVKEHSVRTHDDSKPSGRTIFILNLPPYATNDSIEHVFSEAGKVDSVILQSSVNNEEKINNGFNVGFVVFHKREGLLRALKLNNIKPLSNTEHTVKTGLSKWIEEYNSKICDPTELQEEINNYMMEYEKIEKDSKDKKDEVDDDGWTVVSKKGRNPGVARKESVELKLNEKVKESSKKKELKNFYTFQIRESKMKNIANLRKNYEEAKKKVTEMKSARRFKPY
ncbi:unnamed protein product [Brassicogethes aeneus]|uniref:RRM domain-containing protein n=1 Tax=Brassicogethes aeneus TaxID=1431903 RepID=A0A9P0FAQ9_BRAAE|nr:unnamed protein product [Brassicogethes aeneus]